MGTLTGPWEPWACPQLHVSTAVLNYELTSYSLLQLVWASLFASRQPKGIFDEEFQINSILHFVCSRFLLWRFQFQPVVRSK